MTRLEFLARMEEEQYEPPPRSLVRGELANDLARLVELCREALEK